MKAFAFRLGVFTSKLQNLISRWRYICQGEMKECNTFLLKRNDGENNYQLAIFTFKCCFDI